MQTPVYPIHFLCLKMLVPFPILRCSYKDVPKLMSNLKIHFWLVSYTCNWWVLNHDLTFHLPLTRGRGASYSPLNVIQVFSKIIFIWCTIEGYKLQYFQTGTHYRMISFEKQKFADICILSSFKWHWKMLNGLINRITQNKRSQAHKRNFNRK